ncbi:MAG: YppG family protein, partial [Bacillus sp. (in: Bacteria)]|nr:YppG family protein [Bacillus sp. (in: firmicutes)]
SNQPFSKKDSQFLFQNPLQPQEEIVQMQQYMPMNGYPMMNPYPKQSAMPKQKGGVQTFMNSFKSQDGTVDVSKMVNTAGQMMNAVSQVSSLVKGFGGFFKA